jgi:MoxR-like ATPase
VVDRLTRLRGDTDADPDLVLDGMLLALSGRIHLDEVVEATPEDVLRSIWESYFVLDPARAEPG